MVLLALAQTAQADGIYISNWPLGYNCSVSNWPATQPVSGTFWPATQPVSGTIAVSNFPPTQAVTGTFWPALAASATVSRITVGTVAVNLASANAVRRKVVVFNETGTLRVKLGANASLTDYTYEILASAGNNRQDIDGYSGIISAIKVSGITAVQVTEF